MNWLLIIVIWLALGGWTLALWFGARLYVATVEAEECAQSLDGAHDAIGTLQAQLRQLALEKPMYFRGIPFYHNAHVRTAKRSNFIEWGN